MSYPDKKPPSRTADGTNTGHSTYDGASPAGKFLAKANEALMKLRVAKKAEESREAILLANAALLIAPETCANAAEEKLVKNLSKEMIELRRILLKEFIDAVRLSVEKALESKSEYTLNIAKDLVRTLAGNSFRASFDKEVVTELDRIYSELKPQISSQNIVVVFFLNIWKKTETPLAAFGSFLSRNFTRMRISLVRTRKSVPREEEIQETARAESGVSFNNATAKAKTALDGPGEPESQEQKSTATAVETPSVPLSTAHARENAPHEKKVLEAVKAESDGSIPDTAAITGGSSSGEQKSTPTSVEALGTSLSKAGSATKECLVKTWESISCGWKKTLTVIAAVGPCCTNVYARIKAVLIRTGESASRARQHAITAIAKAGAFLSNAHACGKAVLVRVRESAVRVRERTTAAIAAFGSFFSRVRLRTKEFLAHTGEALSRGRKNAATAAAAGGSFCSKACVWVKAAFVRAGESISRGWRNVKALPVSMPFLSKTYSRMAELFVNAGKSILLRRIIYCCIAAVFLFALIRYAAIMLKHMRINEFEASVKTEQHENAATLARKVAGHYKPAAIYLPICSNKAVIANIDHELAITVGINPDYMDEIRKLSEESAQLLRMQKYNEALDKYVETVSSGKQFLLQQAKVRIITDPPLPSLELVLSNKQLSVVTTNKPGDVKETSLVAGDWHISLLDDRYFLPTNMFRFVSGINSATIRVERETGFCSISAAGIQNGTEAHITGSDLSVTGLTGEPFRFPSGTQSLTIAVAGYRQKEIQANIPPRGSTNYFISLEREHGGLLIQASLPRKFKDFRLPETGAKLVINETNKTSISLPHTVKLPTGQYDIGLELPKYHSVTTKKVSVRDKSSETILFEMAPLDSGITFVSNLGNIPISVYQGNTLVGQAGKQIKAEAFSRPSFYLEAVGYEPLHLQVESPLEPGDNYVTPVTNWVPARIRQANIGATPTRITGILQLHITGATKASGMYRITVNDQSFDITVSADSSGNIVQCFSAPPGKYEVAVDIPGYSSAVPSKVTVTAGNISNQKLEISPKDCYVRFLSRYKHAEIDIYDSDKKIGKCGTWLKFQSFSSHQLLFKGRNFYNFTTEVILDKPGKNMNIEIPIKPSGLSWDRLSPDEWNRMMQEERPEKSPGKRK